MAERPDREALVAELSALSVAETSPDGAVSLSVNTDGVLTRLRLSDEVARMSPAEIADAVMRTYVQAQQESAQRTAKIMLPLGSGGYLMDRLRWRAQFEPAFQKVDEPAPEQPAKRGERDGVVLKDRSETAGAAPVPSGPASEDDYYGKGVGFGPAW